MKLTTKHKPTAHFDMTSATDIMFMLLIFCMLAFSSGSQQSIKINLPASSISENNTPQISITITSDIQFSIDDELIDRKDLKSNLESRIKDEDKNLMVYADKSVPVEYIIYVADVASSLGIKMAIATKGEKV